MRPSNRSQNMRRERRYPNFGRYKFAMLLLVLIGYCYLVGLCSAFVPPAKAAALQSSTERSRVLDSQRHVHHGKASCKMSSVDRLAAADNMMQQVQEVFQRVNPETDRFVMKKFHHIEFYCGDAINTASRFSWGLGMPMVAKSDQSTGNTEHASYVLHSEDLTFVFTAPYAVPAAAAAAAQSTSPFPGFDASRAHAFFSKHGLAGRAIGIEVEDAAAAYDACIAHGGQGVTAPIESAAGYTVSEVAAYGDVVLRFVSPAADWAEPFLPGFQSIEQQQHQPEQSANQQASTCGLHRIDHAVGNVWDLSEAVSRIGTMTGMHNFAEFAAEDVGTLDSGLNSIVLASNNEMVLLPLNEPTYGTPRKSQIQVRSEQLQLLHSTSFCASFWFTCIVLM
jgi:4-hydroxyphenylpyruvate dioxygenase